MSSSDNIEQFEHFDDIDSPEFERHDRYNFEVSLDYLIDSKSKQDKNIFMLEMFGFIPNSLQINEQTYTQSNFYNDLNLYTRYKTPKISLKTLLNPKKTRSPMNRIESYLNTPNGQQSKLKYEIRLLGALSRVNIRNSLDVFATLLKVEDIFNEKNYLKFISRVKQLKTKIQELSEKIEHSSLTSEIEHAFSYMAQFVFVQIELRFSKFLGKFGLKLPKSIKDSTIQLIEETREEKSHFKPLVDLNFTESGEIFEHSEGLLKKFTQRVLYLQQIRKKKENQYKQLAYSIAAGVAMVFSVLLTFFIVSRFQQDTLPFVLGIVVIYMFKDRIKFFIQWLSKKTIRIYIPDRTHKIYDPYEKTFIGTTRETMRFLDDDELPRKIADIRDLERSEIESQENLETVFKYKKIMQLDAKTINKIHTREKNVHDIFRFNIRNFIQYADDTYKEYPVMNKEMDDKIKLVRQYKVYHLNLIFRISRLKSKKSKESFYKKVRIILDQNGIKRLEYPDIKKGEMV